MTELANPFKKTDAITDKSRWVPYVQSSAKRLYKQNCISCHTVTERRPTPAPPGRASGNQTSAFSQSNVPGFTLYARLRLR